MTNLARFATALGLCAASLTATAAPTGATIDQMYIATFGHYTQDYDPGYTFMVMASPDLYVLNNGTTWESGAGGFFHLQTELQSVSVAGSQIEYVFKQPSNHVMLEYTDYDSGDHSSQGTLRTPRQIVITAEKGSTTGRMRGYLEILKNDETWYGEPKFNFYSAKVGMKAYFEQDFELYGTTFTADLFDRSFTYNVSGVIDFERAVRPGLVDLELETSTAALAAPGTAVSWKLDVTNRHAVNDADPTAGQAGHVQVEIRLAGGVTFDSVEGDGWTCRAGRKVTCKLATPLAAGGTSSLTLNLVAAEKGCALVSRASVFGDREDPELDNNEATHTLKIDLPGVARLDHRNMTVGEGAAATLQVVRVGGCSGEAGVMVTTVDGTATARRDYKPVTKTLHWADGDTTPKTVTVEVHQDANAENRETFDVSLSAPTALELGSASTSTIYVNDDDFAAVIVTTSDGGTAVAEGSGVDDYTVVLTSEPVAPVYVAVVPPDGVAVEPRRLRFSKDNWSVPQTVTVSAPQNAVIEASSTRLVHHIAYSEDPKYYGIPVDDVPVVVTNDDSEITFFTGHAIVREDGQFAALTIQRKGSGIGRVSVDVSTADSTAKAGDDYRAETRTLVWEHHDRSDRVVLVPIVNDGEHENAESLIVSLGTPVNEVGQSRIGSIGVATVKIEDDD